MLRKGTFLQYVDNVKSIGHEISKISRRKIDEKCIFSTHQQRDEFFFFFF